MIDGFFRPRHHPEVSVVVQFEKNDSYQGIALAMPPEGVRLERL